MCRVGHWLAAVLEYLSTRVLEYYSLTSIKHPADTAKLSEDGTLALSSTAGLRCRRPNPPSEAAER